MKLNLERLSFLQAQSFPYEVIREHERPLIVLAGYSNVGKSSLINALTKKRTAMISKTPGKTRTINTYYHEDCPFTLIDLPGYGYAKTNDQEKEQWNKMLEDFFEKNESKTLVLNICDARRGVKPLDQELENFILSKNMNFLRIFNKVDLLNQKEKHVLKDEITISVEKKINIDEMRNYFFQFLEN